jgi:3-deoxy-D-manno-octulosonate 8-phosphate phosphatase (KDO 8-P phosphatase)
MDLDILESQFSDIGGQFLTSGSSIQKSLTTIKAYLFDWDGVFNDGSKLGHEGSRFSEVDSAGLRLLRYGHYLKYQSIPQIGVITGASNPVALELMNSHRGNVVYQKSIRKSLALIHYCERTGIKPEEICYVYDDVLDLAIAQKVGLRFCIGRLANPLFLGLVAGSDLADYITATQGNEHAVREICELLLGLMGNYTEVVQEFISDYAQFKSQLQAIELENFEFKDGVFEKR